VFSGIARVQQNQTRILHPTVRIRETSGEFWLERRAGGVVSQVQRARRRQAVAAAEVVVVEQAKPQQPHRPQTLVMWQDKTQRPYDVRRDTPQHFTLQQSLAHQTKFMVFEVAQPAMDQFGGCARRSGAQIAPFAQKHPPAAAGGVAGNATAVDASADDGEIVRTERTVQRA
jgi:hypothetical protein